MNLLQNHELTEWEWDAEGHDQEELKQRFVINGIDGLNWAFRKLAAFKAKEADITQLAETERSRIDYWEAEQKQSLKQDMEFFETLIQQYHAKQLQQDPKAKTLSTPYGTSKSRNTKAQPDKGDEEALLQHIKVNGMTEYIKESVKWGDLKKTLKVVELGENQVVVDENGQLVQGCIVKPANINFSIEVK